MYIYIIKIFSILSNLQTDLFGIDFPKNGPTYGGKWPHGPKHRKDNQPQNLKRAVEYPSWDVYTIKGSFIASSSFRRSLTRSVGRNILERCVIGDTYIFCSESIIHNIWYRSLD